MNSMQAGNESMLMNLQPDFYSNPTNNSMFLHPNYPF